MLTAEGNARSRNLLRRFGNVVEFPLHYLVVTIKSITDLPFLQVSKVLGLRFWVFVSTQNPSQIGAHFVIFL